MMKKYKEYYAKNARNWMLNEPWKLYFSLGRVFERHDWLEWIAAIAEGLYYLGAGLLMLLWLVVRIAFYPITRACVIYKHHKKAVRQHNRKMKKTLDILHEA